MAGFKPKALSRGSDKFSGELRVLKRLSKYEFAVELRIMRDGVNDNKWDFQNIEAAYRTFVGTPILVAYVGNQVGDGHNSFEKYDPKTGSYYQSYMAPTAERIVGTVSENEDDISLVEEGGHKWIVARGRIWKVYAPELVEKIVRTGRMEISAETDVHEQHKNGDIDVFTRWSGLGVTILGEHVPPAIPGANIKALAELSSQFKTMRLRVAALSNPAAGGNEPKNKKKGVNNCMFKNKTLAKELAAKFPNYRVLAFSEDGRNVCLMSKESNETFSYTFMDAEKSLVEAERICPITLSSNVTVGDSEMSIAVNELVDNLLADAIGETTKQLATLSAQADAAAAELDKLHKELDTARNRETARRIKASRQAALDELKAINANRCEEEQIAETCIASLLEAADRGDYAGCENAEGEWTGAEAIESAVRDCAMKEQMALDSRRAELARQARNKRYAFEPEFDGPQGGTGDFLENLYTSITAD